MGLFGSKKEVVMPKVSDVISMEDIQKIREVIEPKITNKEYAVKYSDIADTLLKFTGNPDEEYDKKGWTGIIYSAGCFTKLEPQLEPVLKKLIDNYHAFVKK